MENELAKILASLSALKNNIPKGWVLGKYGEEYNSLILRLEVLTGEKLDEFKIPAHEIKPMVSSFNMISGTKTYSQDNYCDKDYLLMKLDSVLGYFTFRIQPSENKDKMGFSIESN